MWNRKGKPYQHLGFVPNLVNFGTGEAQSPRTIETAQSGTYLSPLALEVHKCLTIKNSPPTRRDESHSQEPSFTAAGHIGISSGVALAGAAAFAAAGELATRAEVVTRVVSLLVQAVIVPGAKTHEGTLIEAVALPWFDIIALLEKDPSIAYQLSWEKWEEMIAGTYKESGFDDVILTPRSGDHGRDVIAIMKGVGSIRVIDSVKAYKPPHLVGYDDVRALIGVLHSDGAHRSINEFKLRWNPTSDKRVFHHVRRKF